MTLVAFGRTALWGLAVAGADGVQTVLRMLNEEVVINMKLAGQKATSQLTPRVIRRIDGSGFATPSVRGAAEVSDPEAALMNQLSEAQRAAVQAIADNADLSDIDKMWSITETVLGGSASPDMPQERTNA